MKKKLLYIFIFAVFFLWGCEKKPADTAPAEVFKMNGTSTAAGIAPGASREDFIKAYKDYIIQVAYNDLDSNYLIMSIEDIPYEENISAMVANFFIDGKPMSEAALCRENKVEQAQLYTLLSSPEYLRKHTVVYRYLRFHWDQGELLDIESDELNYNETFETPKL